MYKTMSTQIFISFSDMLFVMSLLGIYMYIDDGLG